MYGRLDIESLPYKNTLSQGVMHNPLYLGCSGGGGHNAAIEAIIKYMIAMGLVDIEKLIQYEPQLLSEKNDVSDSAAQIELGLTLTHEVPVIRHGVKWALRHSSLPVLPPRSFITEEKGKLNKAQINDKGEKKKRYFIDMLLDVYPTGYDNVAIWNILQKADATEELKKLIELQYKSDESNYELAKRYFIDKLTEAAQSGHPYTEIISTQAMALPALCDAVHYYNEQIVPQFSSAMPIHVHQYMTDLPTKGAVHFFNPLAKLTPTQCEQMVLYGVNLSEKTLEHFQLKQHFAGICSIDPKNNPMVRPGFKQEMLDNFTLSEERSVAVQVTDAKDQDYYIKENEKVASIMLGSLAANDTIEYAAELVKSGRYSKIFVFGGNAPHLVDAMNVIKSKAAEQGITVIPLDNQNDMHMAPILASSQLIIIRGGGLSIMEEMAMVHHEGQVILIHCKEDEFAQLGSGISWEDGNVDECIAYLFINGTVVARTSTKLIADHIERIASSISLDTHLGALHDLLNYFKTKLVKDKKTFDIRLPSFKAIIEAIAAGNVNELHCCIEKAINTYNTGYMSNNYAELLMALDTELNRDGITSLQANAKLLKLINFIDQHIYSLELKGFAQAQSSSIAFLSQETTMEFTAKENHQKEFVEKKQTEVICQLEAIVARINSEVADKPTASSSFVFVAKANLRNGPTLFRSLSGMFTSAVAAEAEKLAIAEKLLNALKDNMQEKEEEEGDFHVKSYVSYFLKHVIIADKENSRFNQDDELTRLLKQAIDWAEKYFPAVKKQISLADTMLVEMSAPKLRIAKLN